MTSWQVRWFWFLSVALSLSGGVYALMKYLLPNDDPFAVINHPLQPYVLKVHILVAPAWLFMLGMLTVVHVLPRFQGPKGPGGASGKIAVFLILLSVVSGYALQIFTSELMIKWTAYVHLGTGLVLAAFLVVHRVEAGFARKK